MSFMESTLLLNASYEPVKIIPWQRAITLVFLGKVEIVEEYDREIRSVSLIVKAPSVVRLLRYVSLGRRHPPLSKLNILARDRFCCQYCGSTLSYGNMTLDHVVPRSRGGVTKWENLVAACHPCNRKKGGRTPREAGMTLHAHPVQPDWLPILTVRFQHKIPASWSIFLAAQAKPTT